MTTKRIKALFYKLGLNESDIIQLKSKGLYRIRRNQDYKNLKIDDEYFEFGDT